MGYVHVSIDFSSLCVWNGELGGGGGGAEQVHEINYSVLGQRRLFNR